MNNIMKNITMASIVLVLAMSSSMVHAAFAQIAGNCLVTDVTANLVGGGSEDADACLNFSGNDGNGVDFSADINTLFGTDSGLIWEQTAKDESFAVGETEWSFTGPLSDPFLIVLKSGNNFAAYLFENLDGIGTGTFDTVGVTGQGISHISLYTTGVSEVPLPAAAFLFAPALLGFMGLRRKANKIIA